MGSAAALETATRELIEAARAMNDTVADCIPPTGDDDFDSLYASGKVLHEALIAYDRAAAMAEVLRG